jgi:phage N-6-adenine-methyltransferase
VSEILVVVAEDTSPLSRDEARAMTDAAKDTAGELWLMLRRLYNGQAHVALGFDSWHAYCGAEFDIGQSRAYQLVDAGRVIAALDSTIVERPANEGQARELVPLLDQPDQLRETWAEVRELHPEPRAIDVREAVQRTRGQLSNQRDGSLAWSTPQDFFDELDQEFGFTLDVCATDESAKCATWFTEREDGLSQPWTGTCWMNPPYGEGIGAWIAKAHDSATKGATVVCLVPARVDTGWWWNYCRYGDVRFLRGRLKFGDGANSAPFPSAVVVFPGSGTTTYWERG